MVDGTDKEAIKEHLMYKLQEQLRSMYPDSLKISDNIDIEISKDINKSSYQSPLMWDPLKNYEHLNYELAFPNFLDYGWPSFFRQFLRPSITIAPANWFIDYSRRMNDAQTWSETG